MVRKKANPMKRETTSIRIDQELWHKAKMKALENRMSIGEFIENLIRKELNEKGRT